MATLRIALTIEFDEKLWYNNDDEKAWFYEECLAPSVLVLHSNKGGDSIGEIVAVEVDEVINAPAMRKVYERSDGEYKPKAAK